MAGADELSEVKVLKRDAEEIREIPVADLDVLTRQLLRPQPQASIGYISDIGFTAENKQRICVLLKGVDLLLSECTFLRAAKEKARSSWHLCSDDVNQLLTELRPRFFLPMHLSKTYSHRSDELYRELAPPEGTKILQIPPQLTPRPLQIREVGWRRYGTPAENQIS